MSPHNQKADPVVSCRVVAGAVLTDAQVGVWLKQGVAVTPDLDNSIVATPIP